MNLERAIEAAKLIVLKAGKPDSMFREVAVFNIFAKDLFKLTCHRRSGTDVDDGRWVIQILDASNRLKAEVLEPRLPGPTLVWKADEIPTKD